MGNVRKNLRKNTGITLVALVITIIILLILAGISIAQLTGTGIFAKAEEAKQKYKEAEDLENEILANYEAQLNRLGKSTVGSGDVTGGSGEHGGGDGEQKDEPTPSNPNEAATSIDEAKSNDMFDKTVNSTIQDEYENQVVVPAGFKITDDASNVTEGIVIEDKDGNQFVWIPVGEVKGKTETDKKTIELSRYTFDEDGIQTKHDDAKIKSCSQELATSNKGNKTAKNLAEFKTSATTNHGYYIGRYEARKNSEGSKVTEKATDTVWNSITQPNASIKCQEMYADSNFISDLMNSYAWDTAIVFIQNFSGNTSYSRKVSVNQSFEENGTENDKICNIYDMASNVGEWTTETYNYSNTSPPCVIRGGRYTGRIH